ncbi:MAG: hypothetical protein ACC645_04810, partial [Pirellulales bacterium]
QSGGTDFALERIEQAWNEPLSLSLRNMPLDQFVASLRARTGLNIRIDRLGLEEEGIGLDAPVTAELRGIRLRSILTLVLRDVNLTWLVHENVVLITTPTESESLLTTRVHDITDLLASYDQDGIDWLIELITTTVAPDAWDEVGGVGSIGPFGGSRRMGLVIHQTREVHEEVAILLASLRAMAASGAAPGRTVSRGRSRSPARRSVRRYVTAPSWSVPRTYE